jgi:hypothetical protein
MLLEKGHIAINPTFDNLITSLRTGVAEENMLDKESTSYSDIFDAYRLALKHYHLKTREIEDDEDFKKKSPTPKSEPNPNSIIKMPIIRTKLGRYCAIHRYIHEDEYLVCDFCNEHKWSVYFHDRYYNYGFSKCVYCACNECQEALFGPLRLVEVDTMLKAYETILLVIKDKSEEGMEEGNPVDYYEAARIAY